MVGLKSVYPGEYRLGKFLHAYLVKNGFRVTEQKIATDRYNYFATKGAGRHSVLFYGHLDTIPLTRLSAWKTNPFVLTNRRGRLYGLGAYDMKGGLSAFLSACAQSSAYVKILLVSDEENISEGAWKAVSGRIQFFRDAELIISAEPNLGLGLNGITTGRTGRCIFEVQFVGKPVHVVAYKHGKDAIEMLSQFISALYQKRDTLFPNTQTVIQVRKISGESVGMSVCGVASLEVEALLDVRTSIADVKKALVGIGAARVSLKRRKTPYLTGYQFDRFPNRNIIADIIKKETGRQMTVHTRTSVGDDNVLATLGIPVVTWGPAGGNAHAPNEYVSWNSVRTLADMYENFLKCL